jgi:hypothetical protein
MNKSELITEIINDGTMEYLLTFSGGEILKELVRLEKDDSYNDFTTFLKIMDDFVMKENESITKLEAKLGSATSPEDIEYIDMHIHYLSTFRDMAVRTIEKVNNYLLQNNISKVTI